MRGDSAHAGSSLSHLMPARASPDADMAVPDLPTPLRGLAFIAIGGMLGHRTLLVALQRCRGASGFATATLPALQQASPGTQHELFDG